MNNPQNDNILYSFQNLSLRFGDKIIFQQTRATVRSGDRIGLLRPNGQGKSTLLKVLAGEVIPDSSTPAFTFDKSKDFAHTHASPLAPLFLYIPQELPLSKYPGITIAQFVYVFYPLLHKLVLDLEDINHRLHHHSSDALVDRQCAMMEEMDRLKAHELVIRYESYLKYFGLHNFDRPMEELSGGEQRKVALSVGLSSEAPLILWDEPTNHLDVETIQKFEDELSLDHLQQSFILITHDRYLLDKLTNKIWHLQQGNLSSFEGGYFKFLEFKSEQQKNMSLQLEKLQNRQRRELAWMRQGIKARGTRSKKRVENFQEINSTISELKSLAQRELQMSLAHSGRKTKLLVQFIDVSFGHGDSMLFENINLTITPKDRIGFMGGNGAGKSTLLKLLRGELTPLSGKIQLAHDLKIVYFDQKKKDLPLDATPYDLLGQGKEYIDAPQGGNIHIYSYLEKFRFSAQESRRPISSFSGGEKNRLYLAMILSQSADLYIFDEPTNDLDIETLQQLEQQITDYPGAFVVVGHDRAFLDNISQKTWLIHNRGLEIFEGGYSQVAPYLEALHLEQEIKEAKESSKEVDKEIDRDKYPEIVKEKEKEKGKNNKQKGRLKKIEEEIEQLEKLIADQKEKVAQFDHQTYTEMSAREKYQKLLADLQTTETKLETLFAEWEKMND